MFLNEKINNDLRQALKQKQDIKVSVLRLLNASIQNKKIEKMRKDEDLSDDEILGVINTEVKKRKDAYEAYAKANRLEAAEKMKKEEDLSDDEILGVINTEAKKRKDAYEAYAKANRLEAAEKERMELDILTFYLPPQLFEVDLKAIIKETVVKTGAKTEKDFGLLMKEVTLQTKGRADGALIAKLVKESLNPKP